MNMYSHPTISIDTTMLNEHVQSSHNQWLQKMNYASICKKTATLKPRSIYYGIDDDVPLTIIATDPARRIRARIKQIKIRVHSQLELMYDLCKCVCVCVCVCVQDTECSAHYTSIQQVRQKLSSLPIVINWP